MMSAVRTSSPASTEGEAVRKLLTFSKEVIIEAFLSVSPFLNVNSVISECKEIYRDNQQAAVYTRKRTTGRHRRILCMEEKDEEAHRRAEHHRKKDRQAFSQINSAKRPTRAVAG